MAYPNLPELDTLTDYRPKMPLRIFTADNVLIGEFGEERRNLVRIKDIPDVMKKAVLAIEDDRFYEHGGVDYAGILRAALHNATGSGAQAGRLDHHPAGGAQLLPVERADHPRKAYEMLLAWKIEKNLSKDQILEVYMNQIYLGQRAFGFSSAAQIYFGKESARHQRGRSGHAGRPAESAVGLQPGGQSEARAHPPAVHPGAHAPARLHHR
jgi:penicillin-binding protein 1A